MDKRPVRRSSPRRQSPRRHRSPYREPARKESTSHSYRKRSRSPRRQSDTRSSLRSSSDHRSDRSEQAPSASVRHQDRRPDASNRRAGGARVTGFGYKEDHESLRHTVQPSHSRSVQPEHDNRQAAAQATADPDSLLPPHLRSHAKPSGGQLPSWQQQQQHRRQEGAPGYAGPASATPNRFPDPPALPTQQPGMTNGYSMSTAGGAGAAAQAPQAGSAQRVPDTPGAPASQALAPPGLQTFLVPSSIAPQLQQLLAAAGVMVGAPGGSSTWAPLEQPQQQAAFGLPPHMQQQQQQAQQVQQQQQLPLRVQQQVDLPPHLQPHVGQSSSMQQQQQQQEHGQQREAAQREAQPRPSTQDSWGRPSSRGERDGARRAPRDERGSGQQHAAAAAPESTLPAKEQVAKLRMLLLELLTEAEAKARRSRRPARDYWVGLFTLGERFFKRWGRHLSAMKCGFGSLEDLLDAECGDVCRLVEGTMGSGPLVAAGGQLEAQGEEMLKAARREVDALEASRRRSSDVQGILRKAPQMPAGTTPLDVTRSIRQLLLRVMRRLAQQEGGSGYGLDELAVDFVREAGFRLDPMVLGCQDLPALLRANFTALATLRMTADGSSCELHPGPQVLQEQQEEQQEVQQQQQQQQQQFHRHADLSPAEPTRDLGGAAGFAAALAGNMQQLLGTCQQLQAAGLPASLTLAQANALGFGAQPHPGGGLLGSAQPGSAGLGLVNGLLNGGQQQAALQPQGLALPQHLFLGADGQLSQQALAGLAASNLLLQQQQQQQVQPQVQPLQPQQQLQQQQPGSATTQTSMFMPSPFMPNTSQASLQQPQQQPQPQQPQQQQQQQDVQHIAQPPQVALAPDLLQQLMGYSQLQHLLQQAVLSGTAQQATTSDGLQPPASSMAPAASQLLMQHVKQQQVVDACDATRGGLAHAVAGMESLGQQYQLQQAAPAPQFVEGFSALQTFPTHTVTDAAAVASYYVPIQQGAAAQYALGTAAAAAGGAPAEAPQPSGPVKYHNHYRTYLGE